MSDDTRAPTQDPNLINAWGLAVNPNAANGPAFWVSANGTGVATVYSASGAILPLVVNVSSPDGGAPTASPTGQVFNSSTAFMGDKFIFDGEDGTISGWQTGTTTVVRADRSSERASYKGLALVNAAGGATLWAANFAAGKVDVFDSAYALSTTTPTDPDLPAGFAPFNVAALGDAVYVAYAKQDATQLNDVSGPGNGYVDVFASDGTLQKRLISGGVLNSPWGMALAPAGFGAFAGDLLIGNFRDGTVNAFDPTSGAPIGSLVKSNGPVIISGLWALVFGPKTASVDLSQTLFYTAGPSAEQHGVFGKFELAP